METRSTHCHKNHRLPAEIISHGVWLYFRFCLSYRHVDECLFGRGMMVTYEAMRDSLPSVEHRQHRYLNNRVENSHQPMRQHEQRMQRLKSPGQAQRSLSTYDPIAQHFRPRRHLLPASIYRRERRQRFHSWQELTSLSAAA